MSDVWAPPRAEVKDVSLSGNPAALDIRQRHIKHEASIKAIGLLSYLGAAIMIPLGLYGLTGHLAESARLTTTHFVLFLVFGVLAAMSGFGLRRLQSWARIVAGILAAIGLLDFPRGTLVDAYILYLLFSKKGQMVFSDEYKQVIADTPDVKYRTSIIVWIFVGLLVAAMGFIALAASLSH